MKIRIEEDRVYVGETLVATLQRYIFGVGVSRTPACTLGQYLALLTLLREDKNCEMIYEFNAP